MEKLDWCGNCNTYGLEDQGIDLKDGKNYQICQNCAIKIKYGEIPYKEM